jgi:hypothetical protein
MGARTLVAIGALALAFATATAEDTIRDDHTVIVPDGYADGGFWVQAEYANAWPMPSSDRCIHRLTFSTGLRMSVGWLGSGIPEDFSSFGVAAPHPATTDSMGFSEWRPVSTDTFGYAECSGGSGDTVWSGTQSMPSSLSRLDSTFWISPHSYDTGAGSLGLFPVIRAVTCCYPGAGYVGCPVNPNHKTIAYVRCRGGRAMKMQIDTVLTDGDGRCGIWHLRWAADSAGNGVYVPTVASIPQVERRTGVARAASPREALHDVRGRQLQSGALRAAPPSVGVYLRDGRVWVVGAR